jgi:hypothetical protein
MNVAQNADTVLVAEGTYYENVKFLGKGVVLTSRYYMTHDWHTIFNTIIDGSTSPNKDTASTVQFLWSEDSTAVINGFTIRGGTGTLYKFPYGTGTAQYQEGAGIILHYSSAIITNNYIMKNTVVPGRSGTASGGGGGIASMYGNPSIYNNIIDSNVAGYAGGIVLNWSGGKVKNNIVSHNSGGSPYGCGGIMVWQVPLNSTFVENNTIVENTSAVDGGGITIDLLNGSTIPVVRNNIVWNNTQLSGKQFTLAQYGTYNDIQDFIGGTNISSDPQFLKGSRYKLASASPCIDAGDSIALCNDKEDQGNLKHALFPSQGGLRNDVGAYGGCSATLFPNENVMGIHEKKSIVQNFELFQNYPNLFNPTTNIEFSLRTQGLVTLKIFDILGREIITLLREERSAGNRTFQWNASKLPSGVYFCAITCNNLTQIKTMMLLK